MRKSPYAIVITLILFLVTLPNSTLAASPKAGAKCTKLNSEATLGGLSFTCIKSGSKLVWSKGIKSTKSASSSNSGSNSNQPNVNVGDACPTKDLKGSIPNGTAICTNVNGKLIWQKMLPPGQEGNSSNKNQSNNSGNNPPGRNNSNPTSINIGDSCDKKGETAPIPGGTAICAPASGKLVWVEPGKQPIPTDGKWIYNTPGSDKWNTDLPPPGWSGEPAWFVQNWDVPTTVAIGSKCPSNTFLTNYITDLDQLESITPQGFMQPGSHAMPVSHMYYNTGSYTEKDPNGVAYRSKLLNLYAPADMTLYSATKSTLTNANGYKYVEWMFAWHFCDSYWMFNAHVGWIAPDVLAAIEAAPVMTCKRGGQLNNEMADCEYERFAYKVKAGTLWGKASGRAHGFDFGFTDASKPLPDRINPVAYAPRWSAGLCHINYYPQAMRGKLEAKLAGNNGCGQLVSDVVATAQGVWLAPGKESSMEDYHVALAKHWSDKDLLAFSVGWNAEVPGMSGGVFTFTPKSGGPNNKPFTSVKSGEVACYDNFYARTRNGESVPSIYIRMTAGDTERLTIAKGSASCGAGPYSMPAASQTFERKVR